MSDVTARTRQQVLAWARELIDLSRRNTTLYFKAQKRATLEVVAPELDEVAALLGKPKPLEFFYPPEPSSEVVEEGAKQALEWTVEDSLQHAAAEQLVTDRVAGSDVRLTLRNLAKRAEADHLDRGVQSLYLCLGLLHWQEAEGEWNRSPLVFVPVTLERPSAREPYRVQMAGEDVVLNPALRVLFEEQFGIELPEVDIDLEESGALEDVFGRVRDALGKPSWQLEQRVVLKRATFHKEAMYRDLAANAEAIAEHELVQTLAVPGAGAELADPEAVPDEEEVDEAAPPEKAHLILDADASQRRAIAAAADGMSIVMDGPPGTGKSQTIANLIGELLAAGKSVLFVSEKSAALDVVANRLSSRGLDDFLIELHDHRTKRREAAQELGRALRIQPRTDPKRRDVDAARAEHVRTRLSDYAEAVNRPRDPLGRSVHWALGRLSQLHDSPRLSPGPIGTALSGAQVAELEEAFERLARRWLPAVEPESFVWRGLRGDGPPTDRLARLASDLRDGVEQVAGSSADLAGACGLGQPATFNDVRRILSVAQQCLQQPWTDPQWWQRDDLDQMRHRLALLADIQHRHAAAREPLHQTYTDAGASLDASWKASLEKWQAQLQNLDATPNIGSDADRPSLEAACDAAQRLVDLARQVEAGEADVAAALGAPERSRSLERINALAEIAELADAPNRPEPHWTVPAVANRVEQAINALEPLQADYEDRVAGLRDVFTPEVLALDLQSLTQRFQETHRGFRKLSGAYRADKRQVVAVARSGRATRDVVARLDDALACQQSAARLDAAEAEYRETLGAFVQPRSSRLEQARDALARVAMARERLADDYDPGGVAAQLAGTSPTDVHLATRAGRLRQTTSELRQTACALIDPSLVDGWSMPELQAWGEAVGSAAARLADILEGIDQARHAPATLATAQQDLESRAALDAANAELASIEEANRADLDAAYQGLATDIAQIDHALQWVEELQRLHGGPLPNTAVEALHGDGPPLAPHPLEEGLQVVDRHRQRLVEAFTTDRASELEGELTGALYRVRETASALAERVREIDEWHGYRQAREALEELGWSAQLSEAETHVVEPSALQGALQRSLWAGWVEAVVATEPDLLTARADDLDAWVREFRHLDEAILNAAAERIVERCNARRPRGSHGVGSIIEREANKKKKHMPIRRLLAETDDVARALKPCFMMSPLTVSQFLPPGFTFDVVIFDEASQVTPADAINCVYRGRQLVVTGDDKQLPPSSFFDRASLDGDSDDYDEGQIDEFESIITQCKSAAGMPSLPLRWHYRSQHEDLITFSNYQYYAPDNQRLHTFPGARTGGQDLGVHLFQVEGDYRRGGPRDNPKEADHVVERVRVHAERIAAQPTEQRETVGVVAFSVAQADAIEHRIDRLREESPHLEEFFAADRLDGFFVKNLENVQGDERDVMIFSVGYGPDEHGVLRSNFGPLNGAHGHRRLNVAITRARRRVEVVCSFAPTQLDSGKATYRGVPDLKRYLEYANQGVKALGLDLSDSEGDVESPFEESVLDVVRSWGYEVVPQVGVAGYRIDLGVRDPNEPDRYALGIECDGRAYHSTRVARDRDRLRADVLRRLGWNLHRIWGPAWYRDRDGEAQRLRAAIKQAIEEDSPPPARDEPAEVARETEEIELNDPLTEAPDWIEPYRPILPRVPQHEHPAEPGAFTETTQIVRAILTREAPIHFEVLARRVADTFERSLTNRVRQAVSDAILTIGRQGHCQQDGDWVRTSDSVPGEAPVRVPTDDPDSERDIEQIPPEELEAAIVHLVADAHLIAENDLLTNVSRLFGVGRTSQRIHATLKDVIERLIQAGRLERNGQAMIRLPQVRGVQGLPVRED